MPEENWPDTELLVATSARYAQPPSLWKMEFVGKKTPSVEGLTNRIYFAGSYRRVFSLIYGYDGRLLRAAAEKLTGDGKASAGSDFIDAVTRQLPILKPIEQILPHVMPIQDAMDFAYFLATVQIQMERWLPGEPLCGGPIDIMVLKTAPSPEILWHPGKTVHHPSAQ